MGTQPPDRDDPYENIDAEDLLEEPGLEVREIDDEEFRTPDGAYSDEPYDPAFQAVIEAGGGVAEGFEQSEAELVDHASHGDDEGTERILEDAFDEEAEPDRAVYGDADEEDVSEDEDQDES